MSNEVGISRSFMTELKSGRTKNPSADTLSKLAAYFNVSVDDLVSLDSYRHGPPSVEQPKITDNDLIFALWGSNPNNMTEEDLERVRSFARYIEQEKKGE